MKASSRSHSSHRELSYPQAIRFLYGLQGRGIKLGLGNIRRLMRSLGNPERKFASLHIAGSNGKGSTAAMIAAMLTAAGYRTALYTSPHLVSFTERIRINGKPVSQRDVARMATRIRPIVHNHGMTFFEAATAIAFRHFADQKVDIAVVETGLGGRLDATNVLRPLISLITGISLEHTQILGNSLQKIAYEKAGIVKRRGVCHTGATQPEVLRVIKRACRKKGAAFVPIPSGTAKIVRSDMRGSIVNFKFRQKEFRGLTISLPGSYQADNVALALHCVAEIEGRFPVEEKSVRDGLKNIERLTGLRGRFSVLARNPVVLGDVAHNPAAMKRLAASLKDAGRGDVVLVFGVMKDKDAVSMIRALRPVVREAIVVQPRMERARRAEELVREFQRQNIPATSVIGVAEGLRAARTIARPSGTVLVTGSHFVVGEALASLEGRKYLTINQ